MAPATHTIDGSALAEMVSRVTQTMCGITLTMAAKSEPLPEKWRLAALSILGSRPLEVVLFSDRASCCTLSAGMFSMPENALDESLIEDALQELLNMTAGQIKSALVPEQVLGLPRILRAESLVEDWIGEATMSVLLKATSAVNLFVLIKDAPASVRGAA